MVVELFLSQMQKCSAGNVCAASFNPQSVLSMTTSNKWHGPRRLPDQKGKGNGGGRERRVLVEEGCSEGFWRGLSRGVVEGGCEGGL